MIVGCRYKIDVKGQCRLNEGKKNTEVMLVTFQFSPIFNLCGVRYDILLIQYVAPQSCLWYTSKNTNYCHSLLCSLRCILCRDSSKDESINRADHAVNLEKQNNVKTTPKILILLSSTSLRILIVEVNLRLIMYVRLYWITTLTSVTISLMSSFCDKIIAWLKCNGSRKVSRKETILYKI